MSRGVTAGVIGARDRPQAFTEGVHAVLQRHGMAAYYAQSGAGWTDLRRTVRETLPDTAVIFVQYAPGWFGVTALLRAVLQWKRDGRFVVLLRSRDAFHRPQQRIAYELVRRAADLELTVAGSVEETLGSWPADRLPKEHRLAAGWRARTDRARVDEILEVMCCPRCRTSLRREGEALICEQQHRFEIEDGIPVLLPEKIELDLEHHDETHEAGDAYQAEAHDGWRELGFYKRDLVARMLRDRPVPRASIDVGCGDWGFHHSTAGGIGRELAVAGDISLELVRYARQAATAPGRIHHMVFSAEALPFREGVFDLVYCSEVIEHLHHPENSLAEMRRVGKGARAILTVPNEQIAGKLEEGHVQTFGYDSFRSLVERFCEIDRVLGVYLWVDRDVDRLARSFIGRLRMRLAFWLGERIPRRALNFVVDGRFR